jgi:hypothetical protein
VGALNVADVCFEKKLHCTTFGTGFVYTYDDAHPMGSGIGFKVCSSPELIIFRNNANHGYSR